MGCPLGEGTYAGGGDEPGALSLRECGLAGISASKPDMSLMPLRDAKWFCLSSSSLSLRFLSCKSFQISDLHPEIIKDIRSSSPSRTSESVFQ